MVNIRNIRLFERERFTPKDEIIYSFPQKAIYYIENVLGDYARKRYSHEGIVILGGTRIKNIVSIKMIIAPKASSNPGRVITSNRANVDVTKVLLDNNLIYIGQVHSHPGLWVDHSDGDDQWIAFKHDGLLSIVVPIYCKKGMSPLVKCGFHRFQSGQFVRLSDSYITNHVRIISDKNLKFMDFRNE